MAVESVRRVDDVFDIINPNENQHSCILQWLFDPREGHGQGEAIFKDFLNAIYDVGAAVGNIQAVFKSWSPGKIAVTGFQSLIVVREKSMVGSGRQDLLLVDPVHKFVILVENKAGASCSPGQLKGYRSALLKMTKLGQPYQGYKTGFVLLDRFKSDEIAIEGELAFWSNVDYSWLEKAARRAEARASRSGDFGHQLVISYCRRQAGYESASERKLDNVLASLNNAHRDVVLSIAAARAIKRPSQKELLLKDINSLIWIWVHQNKDLAGLLVNQKPLAFLKNRLEESFDDNLAYDVRQKTMYVIDKSWDFFRDEDVSNDWPISIKVRDTTDDGAATSPKYSVVIEFWPNYSKDELVAKIRNVLTKLYGKEALNFVNANVRRIGWVRNVAGGKLHDEVKKMLMPLQRELQALIP